MELFDWLVKDDDADMWIVQRRTVSVSQGLQRVGAVVPLVDIMYPIELIPVYGQTVNDSATYKTSQELYSRFYLNSFADKELYQFLRSDL